MFDAAICNLSTDFILCIAIDLISTFEADVLVVDGGWYRFVVVVVIDVADVVAKGHRAMALSNEESSSTIDKMETLSWAAVGAIDSPSSMLRFIQWSLTNDTVNRAHELSKMIMSVFIF